MSAVKLLGALLRGTDGLWIGARGSSSARVKEDVRRKRWACEQAELLEVLEARVKQLQADYVLDAGTRKGQLAPAKKSSFPSSSPQKATGLTPAQKEHALRHNEEHAAQPSRWLAKLSKEKSVKHKRLQRLGAKLSIAVACPKEEPALEVKRLNIGPKKQALSRSKELQKAPTMQDSPAPLCAPDGLREGAMASDVVEEKVPLEEQGGHRYSSIQLSIWSYLDCCLFLGQPERAQQCLMFYHRSHARRKLLDIHMYNLVMHGYAKKGALKQVGWLFHLLEEAGLKPSLDSYLTVLACMGRTQVHSQVIARCLQQLLEDGFRLEDLFRSCTCEEEEAEMALKAVRRVKHGFQPPLPPPLHQTENGTTVPLLRDFYRTERLVSYPKLEFTAQELRDKFRKQVEMEMSDTVIVESVEAAKPLTGRTIKARDLLAMLRARWRTSLLESLQESKRHLDEERAGQLSILPFLCVLEDGEYVDILMQSLSRLPPQGESLMLLAKDLGTKVYNKYVIRKKSQSHLVEKIQRLYEDYVQLLAKDTQPDHFLPRTYWEQLEAEACDYLSLTNKESSWTHSLTVQLGLHLVELLVQALKMESNLLSVRQEPKVIPVLYHVYSFRSGRQIGFIRPHPILVRLLQDATETALAFDSFVIPMLCPPVPWVSPTFGTYVLTPTKLMRCLDGAVQHQRLLEKSPRSDLHCFMDALNQLGNCPWKVNQAILDVVVSIFNDKGNQKLDIPAPPSEAPQPARHFAGGVPLSKSALKREMARCRKKAAEMHSLRMDALYKLSIAKHMRDQVFWFPHNMDFRGRTYPCPPHFNHLGSDLTRAILLFAEGKPLGPRGLDWLKIHLINLTGLKKKSSLPDRLAYANEILADILDSADRPLTGRTWWMNTDEPWQTLACCMEIASATRAPDPAAYISHFPVHQDGSCNGLQHYAALGRDLIGAASVNLLPCDVPQDVYSGVAQQVEMFRKRDAEDGVKLAQVLEGFIGRKVVKQTVMTVVYGVTRYGGRLQIEKRLKELDAFPQEYVWEASHYLVQLVFNSLKEMFSGTREIQGWLTESARLIAKSGRTVEWVTPLGLPIIQPYHRAKTTLLNSSMQSVNLKSFHDISQKPDTVKQKNAFPPNFIHSLDSTHMMLTALHCHRQGLTFVSVHDCYWTHALTVDIMNKVCRDQFVELHQQPILQDLSKFLLQKYCASFPVEWKEKKALDYRRLVQLLSNVPRKGDLDLEKVKESTYFFS